MKPLLRRRASQVARERELKLRVVYTLLQFTPNVVHADEAVVLLDVMGRLRLFRGIRSPRS